jgi:glycosyltransferase involved in cell wall biosynthesis
MARREPSHDARRFAAYARAAARARPQRSAIRLQRAGHLHNVDSAFTQVARFYPVARVAHIERLAHMRPGSFFYTSTRRDWDEDLARATPGVERVGLCRFLARIWTRNYAWLEIPEPYAIALLPHAALIALVVKAKRFLKHQRTALVFYAIENLDQVDKVRSKLPIPAWSIRAASNVGLRLVFSETSRAAFGTSGALDVYRAQLGKRGWQRATRATEIALIPGLSAPGSADEATADRDENLVCFLGSFEERKGILDVLDAWPLVTELRPNSRLAIIGHGPLDEFVEQFACQHENVEVRVDPPRGDIRRTLSSAHALVLPSRRTPAWREQIGLPILEALSEGCEIVTTTETGIADWLRQNGHQVIPTQADDAMLASAIVTALNSTRTRTAVQAALPTTDGRYAADRWLFDGATAPTVHEGT